MKQYYIERFTVWFDDNMTPIHRQRLWRMAANGHYIRCVNIKESEYKEVPA